MNIKQKSDVITSDFSDDNMIIPKNVKNYNDPLNSELKAIHGVSATSGYIGKTGLTDCLSDQKTKKIIDNINEQLSVAVAETLYYLRGIKQEDIDKIPQEFVNLLFDNTSKEHKSNFDNSIPLNDLNISEETRGIIGTICYRYWCENEDQKKEYLDHLSQNEKNTSVISSPVESEDESAINDTDDSLIKTQELKWYQKISNFFKNLFKKEK